MFTGGEVPKVVTSRSRRQNAFRSNDFAVPTSMNLFQSFGPLSSAALCLVLAACAGSAEPPAPAVVRTPPPQGYEKTIHNYFAFKIRSPQKNAQINVARPEPGGCALDGHFNSIRGWVVPVAYETRTGELTGRETIRITAKPYYFWFLGNTIAGVTPRLETCPGLGSAFDEGEQPGAVAGALRPTSFPSPAAAEPGRVDTPEPPTADRAHDAAKPQRVQKADATQAKKKKTSKSSGGVRKAKKAAARRN